MSNQYQFGVGVVGGLALTILTLTAIDWHKQWPTNATETPTQISLNSAVDLEPKTLFRFKESNRLM